METHKSFRIMLVEDSPTAAELANYWLQDGLGDGFYSASRDAFGFGSRIVATKGRGFDDSGPESVGQSGFGNISGHSFPGSSGAGCRTEW